MSLFNYSGDNKAIGPMYLAQLTLQLFIDDSDNDEFERVFAADIHRWLGMADFTIDHVFQKSYDYGIFLLHTMKTYELNETRNQYCFISQFMYAVNSLQTQYDHHIENEEIMYNMALTAITDTT
jgi:hypothetical protein